MGHPVLRRADGGGAPISITASARLLWHTPNAPPHGCTPEYYPTINMNATIAHPTVLRTCRILLGFLFLRSRINQLYPGHFA